MLFHPYGRGGQSEFYAKGESIIFLANFKICLRMLADRADLRSLGSYYDMSAVTTLPDGNAALLKYLHSLDVAQQLAVALLMGLLDGSHTAELLSQLMEAFFVSFTGHTVVHIRPLGVLTLGGMEQVLGGIAQLAQSLEPQLCVLFFVFRGLEEQGGNLLVARLLGNRGKVGVLIPCLRFTDIL